MGHGEWLPGEEQTKSSGCSTSHPQSHPYRVSSPKFKGVQLVYFLRHRFIQHSTTFNSPTFRLCFMLQNTLRTPVYTTSLRRNAMGEGLVFEADLFTTKHSSHWVIQGVCLCLNAE